MRFYSSRALDNLIDSSLSHYEINFILLEVLGRTLEDIRIKGISAWEVERIEPYLQMARRYPVEYIFKKAFFRNLVLYVDERVLIPRNETEQLVDIALHLIQERTPDRILEVGTGSGAIAISIASESGKKVFASDVSPDAIEVASMNVRSHKTQGRVLLFVGDGLKAVDGEWDLIIWNHPYVLPQEYEDLPPKVKVEPAVALISTPDALVDFLREGMKMLSRKGVILLESAPRFIERIKKSFPDIRVVKDLYGVERFVLLERR